jgi:hypothetical protein
MDPLSGEWSIQFPQHEGIKCYPKRLMLELGEPQPGGLLLAQQLAYMMLVQALRLHLAQGLSGGVGWIFALADQHGD